MNVPALKKWRTCYKLTISGKKREKTGVTLVISTFTDLPCSSSYFSFYPVEEHYLNNRNSKKMIICMYAYFTPGVSTVLFQFVPLSLLIILKGTNYI